MDSMFEYSDTLTLSERVSLRVIMARLERTERELRDLGLSDAAHATLLARRQVERDLNTFSPKGQ